MSAQRIFLNDKGTSHLVAGLQLPDISLESTRGRTVNFRVLAGRAVIFFYPWTGRPGMADPPAWDDIPGAHGSTPEAAGFCDHHGAFRKNDVMVAGVSTQGSEHQREFAKRLKIPFDILSDDTFRLQRALSLPTFETGGVAYLKRLTLIVRDGRIESVFYPVPEPGVHAREVLDWMTQTGKAGAT